MARWLGFDSYARASDAPGAGVKTLSASCSPNPSTNNLAKYAKDHYTNRNPPVSPPLKFFARYFFTSSGGGVYSASSETSALSAAQFNFLIVISSPSSVREATTGTTGFNYGVADANSTLSNIISAMQNGGMGVNQSTSRVYVYLDVEPDVALSQDYWNGFSETIYKYVAPSGMTTNCPAPGSPVGAPFFACAYANPIVSGRPNNQQTMNVLTKYSPSSPYPDYPWHFCYGLWTQQTSLSTCAACSLNPPPDWSNAVGYSFLTLHFYQHSINETCCGPAPAYTDCEGNCRPWVDDDQSTTASTFEIMYYILQIC